MNDEFFPQGIAVGEAFCNRELERAKLKANIKNHENVVLVAPRRNGKTSLMAQVLYENDFYGTSLDFLFVLTQSDVNKIIAEGVSAIVNSMLPKTKKIAHAAIDAVKNLNPKLTFNLFGQQLEIHSKNANEKSITELLLSLDQFAQQLNKSCVLVLDEFQQIGELSENHAIEAAIRHAVERSKNVSYIFCGSKRHLLKEMFSSKSRPLYHLCDLMTIERISTSSYKKFINKFARKKWQIDLDEDVIQEIIYLTENHPYYVNVLCRNLWRNDEPPTIETVRNTWNDYVDQQSAWIITDISELTLNRKKVLNGLVFMPTNEPLGKAFSQKIGVAPSSIKACLDYLIKFDLIYQDKQGYYKLLDPAINYYIIQYSKEVVL